MCAAFCKAQIACAVLSENVPSGVPNQYPREARCFCKASTVGPEAPGPRFTGALGSTGVVVVGVLSGGLVLKCSRHGRPSSTTELQMVAGVAATG
jgi:hypothetical protein